jgi:hypothetical protein
MPFIVHLKPTGWAMLFDGTPECGAAIAAQLWPQVEAASRHQVVTFIPSRKTAVFGNPGRGPMLVTEKNEWLAYHGEKYSVVRSLSPDWLDGTSPLTRKILDEWMRR